MARNTQAMIADALKRLMAEKELDKITVQDIADAANVNKKTFYYHFHGISDLIRWMHSVEFYETIDAEGVGPDNWASLVRRFTERVKQDSDRITAIYCSSYGAEFRQSVVRMFDRATEKYIRSSVAQYEKEHGCPLELTPVQLEYIAGYHSMALYGILEKWFLRGMKDPVEEFLNLIQMMNILTNDSLSHAFHVLAMTNSKEA